LSINGRATAIFWLLFEISDIDSYMVDNRNQKCKQCKKIAEKNPKLQWASNDLCLECHNKPKPKFYYDVKVEVMLPAVLTYRVLAEDAQKAADMIRNIQPTSVKHKLIGKKEIKLTVYDAGCTVIKFMKNLFGG
jgi:hypothetical protein